MSTNTKLAEAARLLDDAIKDLPDGCEGWLEPLDERIAELRAALAAHDAEQAQEPVAWRVWRGDSYELFFNEEAAKRRCECFIRKGKPEPIYAAPVEQAAKAVPADLRSAAERTRQDLGPTGSNYPDVRVLLAFVEQALAAHTPPAPDCED